ncbi:hypothetical protein ND860_18660 [Leptospira levettii]|uniref:hypothetical protein n=1 Tax=Leptospira levettii TaxID=2023178 RepID=UPI00223CDA19|nr:hypothetical protein [Leptospira levettii]MCW7498564.1 hypothetical protein [Leptospira levettii]
MSDFFEGIKENTHRHNIIRNTFGTLFSEIKFENEEVLGQLGIFCKITTDIENDSISIQFIGSNLDIKWTGISKNDPITLSFYKSNVLISKVTIAESYKDIDDSHKGIIYSYMATELKKQFQI